MVGTVKKRQLNLLAFIENRATYYSERKIVSRTCCWIFPLETLHLGNPNGGVAYLRIILSPEEAFRTCISVFGKRLSRKSNNVEYVLLRVKEQRNILHEIHK